VSARGYHFVLPGPPETPTGGFAYDRQMIAALARAGRLAGTVVLAGDFPRPSPDAIMAAARAVAALPAGAAVVVDGLAFAPLADVFAAAVPRLGLYALVHHPLADETGLGSGERAWLYAQERRALALAKGVVVTSAHTARRLAELAVPAQRIRVVRPGIETRRPARGGARFRPATGAPPPPVLLCVGSLAPRKGQDVLLRALAGLRTLDWRLLLAGPARHPAYAGRLRRLAGALGLAPRVAFLGAVSEAALAGLYRSAQLFVFPSHYEGFGIAVAEAAAYGLPIVASDAGAIPEAVEGARYRLVPPGDPAALAHALRPFLAASGRLAAAPPRGRPNRPWRQAGCEFVAALDGLHAG
jgi:glycosyltransferase involved in cell wall biosynthesis